MSDERQYQGFDELFKNGLYDHQVTPPQHVWQNMEGRLHSPRAQANDLFAKSASVLLALALSASLAYFARNGSPHPLPDFGGTQQPATQTNAPAGGFFATGQAYASEGALFPTYSFSHRLQNKYAAIFAPLPPELRAIAQTDFSTLAYTGRSSNTRAASEMQNLAKSGKNGHNGGRQNPDAPQNAAEAHAAGHFAPSNPLAISDRSIVESPDQSHLAQTDFAAAPPNRLPSLAAGKLHHEPLLELETSTTAEQGRTNHKKAAKLPRKPFAKTTGFYFGGIGSVSSSWIFNRKAVAESPQGALTYRPDFGTAYGFALGYDFNEAWGMELNWIVNSHQGQKFMQLRPESKRNNQTDINLTYTYFPVLLKYKMTRTVGGKNPRPLVINCLGGIQYGKLRSAEINLYNTAMQGDLLQKTNWGIVMGIDTHWYLTDHYFLSLGLRSTITASSRETDRIAMPGPGKTNSLLVSLQAGLHYRFAN